MLHVSVCVCVHTTKCIARRYSGGIAAGAACRRSRIRIQKKEKRKRKHTLVAALPRVLRRVGAKLLPATLVFGRRFKREAAAGGREQGWAFGRVRVRTGCASSMGRAANASNQVFFEPSVFQAFARRTCALGCAYFTCYVQAMGKDVWLCARESLAHALALVHAQGKHRGAGEGTCDSSVSARFCKSLHPRPLIACTMSYGCRKDATALRHAGVCVHARHTHLRQRRRRVVGTLTSRRSRSPGDRRARDCEGLRSSCKKQC